MKCTNTSCGQEIEAGSQFCTHCGSKQIMPATSTGATLAPKASSFGETLIMRASEKIWDFTESEGDVRPAQRRPTIVLDEQSTHLSHTDQKLSMTTLHERINRIVRLHEVPVEINLVRAQWINDAKESRERIVASLSNHMFNDIKVIFGLDYMGKWASIHITVGMEPTPVEEFKFPEWIKIVLAAAGVCLLIGLGMDKQSITTLAIVLAGFSVWSYFKAKRKHEGGMVAAAQRLSERMSRTYKIDDVRLFCTAMNTVYKAVVDDIVQTGAKVIRVAGGHGGYLGDTNDAGQQPSSRISNASHSEV